MRSPPLPIFVLVGVLIGAVMPMPKQQHKDSIAIVVDTPPIRNDSISFLRLDTIGIYRNWWKQPQSLMFVTGGATVLTITPEGKFILGPGATVDSAASTIVRLAEEYVAWKRCNK